MDTNRLRYFAMVARLGSAAAAARAMDVTPAAVSKSVRALERELGFDLLIPSGRGIVVTDRGRLVAERIERLLHDLEALHDPDVLAIPTAPSVRLGTCSWFASHLYPALARHVAGDVHLYDANPTQLQHALVSGTLDVVVGSGASPHPGISHHRAGRMPMGVFARAPLAASSPATVPFAVHGATSVTGAEPHGGDGWPLAAHGRTVGHRVGSSATVLELCRQGIAAAYLPLFVADAVNRDATPSARLQRMEWPRLSATRARLDVHVSYRVADVDRVGADAIEALVRSTCCT